MTLVRKNTAPYVPSILEELFNTDWLGGRTSNFVAPLKSPAVNILEQDQSFRIEVAAPGYIKADFQLELDNQILILKVDKEDNNDIQKEQFARREFSIASFERSFKIPKSVDVLKIKATYNNGILVIALPKKKEAQVQPPRSIEIA